MNLFLKKRPYEHPRILRESGLVTECQLLSGSIVDKTGVRSVGQEVDDINWSDTQFNHDWEEN